MSTRAVVLFLKYFVETAIIHASILVKSPLSIGGVLNQFDAQAGQFPVRRVFYRIPRLLLFEDGLPYLDGIDG